MTQVEPRKIGFAFLHIPGIDLDKVEGGTDNKYAYLFKRTAMRGPGPRLEIVDNRPEVLMISEEYLAHMKERSKSREWNRKLNDIRSRLRAAFSQPAFVRIQRTVNTRKGEYDRLLLNAIPENAEIAKAIISLNLPRRTHKVEERGIQLIDPLTTETEILFVYMTSEPDRPIRIWKFRGDLAERYVYDNLGNLQYARGRVQVVGETESVPEPEPAEKTPAPEGAEVMRPEIMDENPEEPVEEPTDNPVAEEPAEKPKKKGRKSTSKKAPVTEAEEDLAAVGGKTKKK